MRDWITTSQIAATLKHKKKKKKVCACPPTQVQHAARQGFGPYRFVLCHAAGGQKLVRHELSLRDGQHRVCSTTPTQRKHPGKFLGVLRKQESSLHFFFFFFNVNVSRRVTKQPGKYLGVPKNTGKLFGEIQKHITFSHERCKNFKHSAEDFFYKS